MGHWIETARSVTALPATGEVTAQRPLRLQPSFDICDGANGKVLKIWLVADR